MPGTRAHGTSGGLSSCTSWACLPGSFIRSTAICTPGTPFLHPLQSFNKSDALRAIFSEYGEVVHCYIPRSATDASRTKGFAFVGFKHSFAADA